MEQRLRQEAKAKAIPLERSMAISKRSLPRSETEIGTKKKINGSFHYVVLLTSDTLAIALAFILSCFIRVQWLTSLGMKSIDLSSQLSFFGLLLLVLIPLWLLIFALYGLYEKKLSVSSFDEIPTIFAATTMGILITITSLYFARYIDYARVSMLLAWALSIVMVLTGRVAARFVEKSLKARGHSMKNTVIMGAGQVGKIIAKKIIRHPELGLRLVGFLDRNPLDEQNGLSDYEVLGSEKDLFRIIKQYDVRHVIVAFSTTSYDRILRVIRRCDEMDVDFTIVPRFFEILTTNVSLDDIEGIPVIGLKKTRSGSPAWYLKSVLDFMMASLALLILSPLFLIAAIAIKLDSPGPVFFLQDRLGKDEKPFKMYKFRSMVPNADGLKERHRHLNEAEGALFKIKEDPRLTRVGRVIRKYSIDELPQLFNVIRGEMSLVGPRPLPVNEALMCKGWRKKRASVLPGITGVWQVLGRSDLPFDEMVKLDYLYIQNRSSWLDFKILSQTVSVVLFGRGAY
jgi:exopolysaccharide biosynthesis polyprenyl glycosylphosphotransferase